MDEVESWNFMHGLVEARSAGFKDWEMVKLLERWTRERDKELQRRLLSVPRAIRDRIVWDSAIENLIPLKRPDVRPGYGYMILPVRDSRDDEEQNVIILPPSPLKAVEIRWPWTSDFFSWVVDPQSDRGAEWLRMMTEEFGLLPEQEGAWVSPNRGSSVWDVKKYAAFWRDLKTARRKEAERRLTAMANWLETRGMDGMVTLTDFIVIIPWVGDHDPERSTFIFRVELKRDTYCMISHPYWTEPFFLVAPFSEAKDFFQSQNVELQNQWLRQLRDGCFD